MLDVALPSMETVRTPYGHLIAYIWRQTRTSYCPDFDPYVGLSQEHLFELATAGSAALGPVAQPWDTQRRHPGVQRAGSFRLCTVLQTKQESKQIFHVGRRASVTKAGGFF